MNLVEYILNVPKSLSERAKSASHMARKEKMREYNLRYKEKQRQLKNKQS